MGFNGIMSGIKDFILGEQYSDKKVAYLWNNISKLSVGGRNGVCKEIHELEKKILSCHPSGDRNNKARCSYLPDWSWPKHLLQVHPRELQRKGFAETFRRN